MKSLADILVEQGILTSAMRPLTLTISILGHTHESVLKRTAPLPSVYVYTPVLDVPELSSFCANLNKLLSEKLAAEEILIATPFHLMSNNDINDKLAIAKKYTTVCQNLSFMTRKEVYEILSTKDGNMIRATSRLVQLGRLFELKVGALAEPLYPTFQFNEDLLLYPGVESVVAYIHEHNTTMLSFCEWVADESGFIAAAKQVNKKYKKLPFSIFSDIADTIELLTLWSDGCEF